MPRGRISRPGGAARAIGSRCSRPERRCPISSTDTGRTMSCCSAASLRAYRKRSTPQPMFFRDYDALYEKLRTEKPKSTKQEGVKGDVDGAMKLASRVIEARYEYPFQSHASMGPGCAVADVRDGGAMVWSGGQKPYPVRAAVAGSPRRGRRARAPNLQSGPGNTGPPHTPRLALHQGAAPYPDRFAQL